MLYYFLLVLKEEFLHLNLYDLVAVVVICLFLACFYVQREFASSQGVVPIVVSWKCSVIASFIGSALHITQFF